MDLDEMMDEAEEMSIDDLVALNNHCSEIIKSKRKLKCKRQISKMKTGDKVRYTGKGGTSRGNEIRYGDIGTIIKPKQKNVLIELNDRTNKWGDPCQWNIPANNLEIID